MHDERENTLQIFWKKGVDVLSWLAETNQDEHLQRLRSVAKHHSSLMEADSGKGAAEQALFDDDDDDEEGEEKPANGNGRDKLVFETDQHRKSREVRLSPLRPLASSLTLAGPQRIPLKFEGLSTENGHAAQTVKTLDRVPVVISVRLFARLQRAVR